VVRRNLREFAGFGYPGPRSIPMIVQRVKHLFSYDHATLLTWFFGTGLMGFRPQCNVIPVLHSTSVPLQPRALYFPGRFEILMCPRSQTFRRCTPNCGKLSHSQDHAQITGFLAPLFCAASWTPFLPDGRAAGAVTESASPSLSTWEAVQQTVE
jgi:hypothetical protein